MLRAYLKRRRFPTVTKMERDFSEIMKALKLSKDIRIKPPAYFEGGPYVLRMTFMDMDGFRRGCKTLDGIAQSPALEKMFDR
jgi:hypothetical protein